MIFTPLDRIRFSLCWSVVTCVYHNTADEISCGALGAFSFISPRHSVCSTSEIEISSSSAGAMRGYYTRLDSGGGPLPMFTLLIVAVVPTHGPLDEDSLLTCCGGQVVDPSFDFKCVLLVRQTANMFGLLNTTFLVVLGENPDSIDFGNTAKTLKKKKHFDIFGNTNVK